MIKPGNILINYCPIRNRTVNTVGPITPDDVVEAKEKIVPPAVFQAFNQLISEKWDGHHSKVLQHEAVALILSLMPELNGNDTLLVTKGWLDIEPVYRRAGWKVEYDKPAYNESYRAFFVFSKP